MPVYLRATFSGTSLRSGKPENARHSPSFSLHQRAHSRDDLRVFGYRDSLHDELLHACLAARARFAPEAGFAAVSIEGAMEPSSLK